MFPPTFLYTQSWEDPRPDMQVRALLELQVHCIQTFAALFSMCIPPLCDRARSVLEA